ncbi:putative diguanylate cyclase (GGDEF domain) [Sulfurospirillum multivorans DSM 12446]|uniref:diguanylate cyclase n=2 Tax=Sulfurospirillum multivorans TaxID=66821 RepID=A0AA86ALS9_SULMK|nr:putative diguanylate cyclase (GGDEF domain) [Sulfurospirillum multivorans DSM 12446]
MDQETLYKLVIVVLIIGILLLLYYYQKRLCELKLHNGQLELLSQYDDLTQIYNRRYFLEIVQYHFTKMYHQKPSAIMMIDIDHFKQINDTHGHILGDDVLQYVVKLISEHLRESDIFARYGGDEFIVFFPAISQKDIYNIALRIQSKLFEDSSYASPVTLSIGICLFSTSLALQNVIEYADNALYSAKSKGRNRIEFYPS